MSRLEKIGDDVAVAISECEAELDALRAFQDALRSFNGKAAGARPAPRPAGARAGPQAPARAAGQRRARRAPLTADECRDRVRQLLLTGPHTVGALIEAIGRANTPHAQRVVSEVAGELGAVKSPRTQAWEFVAPDPGDIDAAHLERQILALLEQGMFDVALIEERIGESEGLRPALDRMLAAKLVVRTGDGMWTAV